MGFVAENPFFLILHPYTKEKRLIFVCCVLLKTTNTVTVECEPGYRRYQQSTLLHSICVPLKDMTGSFLNCSESNRVKTIKVNANLLHLCTQM